MAAEPLESALQVALSLQKAGFQAFLVGGCVRDLLLGREPKDFDLATDARPEQILELHPDADLVGAHFGVVLVRHGGFSVEVATFRSDHSYQDGRHPERVEFETDPRQDALRRDFTINALFMDPVTRRVADYVGGCEDLARGVIRAIGEPERRFEEDHLRMLRAVRFAARFGFTIDPATLAAIQTMAAAIHRVSAERVRDELVRILTEGGARRGFELLDETGLLQAILPEVAAMKGVEQPPQFHPEGDVWVHTLLMLEGLRSPTPTQAFGVLLHDVGKPPTFRIADRIRFDGHVEAGVEIAERMLLRLRCSNEEIERVKALVANHMKFADLHRMKASTLKRFLRQHHFEEHLELHRLDCTSSHGSLENYEMAKRLLAELPEEQLQPPRLLTGADLIAAGYKPGPQFKEVLAAVEDAQLEGTVKTREEALELIATRWPPSLSK